MISHPNYITFTKNVDASPILAKFISELKDVNNWQENKLANPIIENYNKGSLKLKIWKADKEFKQPLYLVMITCFSDNILIDLGIKHGILRGFPIIYVPNSKIKFFGFKRKFNNDTKQATIPTYFKGAAWFKKFSGFLGQLLAFEHEGQYFWTSCSKNSADSTNKFVSDCGRLFAKYITKPLLNIMIKSNIHLCAEVMSSKDQHHGARVYSEMPVITSMSKGAIIDLKNKKIIDAPQKGYITPFGFKETIEFCRTFCLKVGSAVICSNKACAQFLRMLHNSCDVMDDTIYEQILSKVVSNYPKEIKVVEGTMTHAECLGNILEGLVIHSINTTEDIEHNQVVSLFENQIAFGNEKIVYDITKYKFPKYTVRTMCIRQAENLKITIFNDFVKKWAKHWCITQEGYEYWYNFAWAVKFKIIDNMNESKITPKSQEVLNRFDKEQEYIETESGLTSQQEVGDHIIFSDYVLEHGIPKETNMRISKIIGSVIKLEGAYTLVYPFANEKELDDLRTTLEQQNFHVLKTKNPPKNIQGYINLTKIPTKPNKNTGPVFQIKLSEEDISNLEMWQTKKIEGAHDESIIMANDKNDVIEKITEYVKASNEELASKLSPEITEIETSLSNSLNGTITKINGILEDFDAQKKNAIILCVGVQCIGKSTIFANLLKNRSNISQCSADIFMGNSFNPNRLIECHKACQKAVIESIQNGFHAFVDNTNILAEHRTSYKILTDLLGVELVVVNVCQEYWLNCSNETRMKTINALENRSKIREAKTGKIITKEVIQRTIDTACEDYKKFAKKSSEVSTKEEIESWLNYFPTPSFIEGLSYYNSNIFMNKKNKIGAFSYSSQNLLDSVSKYIKNPMFQRIENINNYLMTYYTTRNFGNHITIIDPNEINTLKSKNIKIPNIDTIKVQEDFEVMGVGNVTQDTNSVYYLVIKWQWAQDFRKSLGLENKDLHCTMAFKENDIFGVSKDISTMII